MIIPNNLLLLLATQDKFQNPFTVIIYKLIESNQNKDLPISSAHLKNIYKNYSEIIKLLADNGFIRVIPNIGPREVLVNSTLSKTKVYATINTYLTPNKYVITNNNIKDTTDIDFEYTYTLKNITDKNNITYKVIDINNYPLNYYNNDSKEILFVKKSKTYFDLGTCDNDKSILKRNKIEDYITLKNENLTDSEIANALKTSIRTIQRYKKELTKENNIKVINKKEKEMIKTINKTDLFKQEILDENDQFNVTYEKQKVKKIKVKKEFKGCAMAQPSSDEGRLEANRRYELQKEKEIKQKAEFEEFTNKRLEKENEQSEKINIVLDLSKINNTIEIIDEDEPENFEELIALDSNKK